MKTQGRKTSMVSLVAVILGGLAASVFAQGATASEGFVNPADIKWGPAPPSLPQGTKIAVLQGDPGKPGPFVIRLMVAPGSKISPHWHSQDESLTLIAGTVYFGYGDKVEKSKSHVLTAGGFHFLAGNDHHYLVAKSQAIVQVNGNGPFDIMYSDSNDGPQTATK